MLQPFNDIIRSVMGRTSREVLLGIMATARFLKKWLVINPAIIVYNELVSFAIRNTVVQPALD
jgi:hypothetical protein